MSHQVVKTRVMYLAFFLLRKDDPRIKQVTVLKVFHYFNNHHILIPMCSLNQFKLINFHIIDHRILCHFGPEPVHPFIHLCYFRVVQ